MASLLNQKPPFQGAIAIHLFKAGRLLLDIQVPYGVIFGGTDINEDVKVEQKRQIMEQVLQKARFAVAFTNKMKEEATIWLSQSAKIYIQPQGISTDPAERFCWKEFLMSSGVPEQSVVEDLQVFLLVCGLRRVKDPLYLLETFSEWHRQDPVRALVVIGPKIDPVLSEEVEAVTKRSVGVFLAQDTSQERLNAAMKRSLAVVNSSLSEGMSAAILEAMDLGVPVIARNIPGNAAVVQHEITGLLFSSPQDFVFQANKLLEDAELRETVVRNGKTYVKEHHSLVQERETYQRLVQTL